MSPVGPDAVSLDGKVALVTGAAPGHRRGDGRSRSPRFGADLAICDRNVDGHASHRGRESRPLGRRCVTGELDVRDADGRRRVGSARSRASSAASTCS